MQLLDIIEDAFYAVALLAEEFRRIAQTLCILAIMAVSSILGTMLALFQPVASLAIAALLALMVLYRNSGHAQTDPASTSL